MSQNRYYVTDMKVVDGGVMSLELTLIANGPFELDEARLLLVGGGTVVIEPSSVQPGIDLFAHKCPWCQCPGRFDSELPTALK